MKNKKQFLWGAATSSHQVEGDATNDWSEWEKEHAQRLSEESDGAYPAGNYISGTAADHYNRYEQDFNIAQELGHNAHRFSIEWSRIEPAPGRFDKEAIKHYQSVITALRARGIEPMVTIYHWTIPLWFRDIGGWLNPDAPEYFERFSWALAHALPDVKYWATINEPLVYTGLSYMKGIWPPQKRSLLKTIRVLRAMVDAHKRAYNVLHRLIPGVEVGIVKHNKYFSSFGASVKKYFWNDWFLEQIQDHGDFIGLNYYNGDRETETKTDMNWPIDPEGFYKVLMELKRYGKPIYITENGLADHNDSRRPEFIRQHIWAMERAMKDGAEIKGYFHWSLLDNFEWDKGFWPEFGLVHIDRRTLKRTVRKSAFVYKKIIDNRTR